MRCSQRQGHRRWLRRGGTVWASPGGGSLALDVVYATGAHPRCAPQRCRACRRRHVCQRLSVEGHAGRASKTPSAAGPPRHRSVDLIAFGYSSLWPRLGCIARCTSCTSLVMRSMPRSHALPVVEQPSLLGRPSLTQAPAPVADRPQRSSQQPCPFWRQVPPGNIVFAGGRNFRRSCAGVALVTFGRLASERARGASTWSRHLSDASARPGPLQPPTSRRTVV